MPGGGLAHASTADVSAADAFAYWRDLISQTFVPLTAEPLSESGFRGAIDHVRVGSLELSSVVAGPQAVRRTRSLVSQGDGEFLLCSIQVRGRGLVEQDGRAAFLEPGDLTFYDSTRPYALTFDEAFEQLVVQVPRCGVLAARTDPRSVTARVVPAGGMGAPVGGFFRGLVRTLGASGQEGLIALPHALGLLRAAAGDGRTSAGPRATASSSVTRDDVVRFLRDHVHDSALDSAAVARAFHVSRRTLYRLFADSSDGGVMNELRRLRIERATELLGERSGRSVAAIAHACGYESESAFHRAFRAATGLTPRAH